LKKSDKVIYNIIKLAGILAIAVISYFIIFSTMNLMNSMEYAKILIDMDMYTPFYNILNIITQLAIPIFFFMLLAAIPYLIVCIILCIIFIRKYVKFKGEKEKQIIKIILLGILTIYLTIKGISLLPLTSEYEIKVNSKINEVSNIEVREFLQKELKGNKYVYKINIRQGFPDDYVVQIHYQDATRKVEDAFLSDYDYDFINTNAKNITNELTIKSIILTLVGDVLCIYLLIYVLKVFKRISTINKEIREN